MTLPSSRDVAVVKCGAYNRRLVYRAVSEAVDLLGGMGRFVRKGDAVLIKPNLLKPERPSAAITTHPAVVAAVIRLVKEAGGIPFVGDNSARSSVLGYEKIAGICGLKDICDELGARLVELDKPVNVRVKGRVFKTFQISGKLSEFDAIINLPKLKTHVLTVYTGAVKNLYGCVPGKRKAIYHALAPDGARFSAMLLDLGLAIRPCLTIMDGVVGMEGNGPGAGDPRKIGVIVAGRSNLAVDVVSTEIVGIRRKVPLLSIAASRGLAEADISRLRILGEDIEKVRIKGFKLPSVSVLALIGSRVKGISSLLADVRPVAELEMCIGCEGCLRICPMEAIRMEGSKPLFDYQKCIRCYCCMEGCPKKAISQEVRYAGGILKRSLRHQGQRK